MMHHLYESNEKVFVPNAECAHKITRCFENAVVKCYKSLCANNTCEKVYMSTCALQSLVENVFWSTLFLLGAWIETITKNIQQNLRTVPVRQMILNRQFHQCHPHLAFIQRNWFYYVWHWWILWRKSLHWDKVNPGLDVYRTK